MRKKENKFWLYILVLNIFLLILLTTIFVINLNKEKNNGNIILNMPNNLTGENEQVNLSSYKESNVFVTFTAEQFATYLESSVSQFQDDSSVRTIGSDSGAKVNMDYAVAESLPQTPSTSNDELSMENDYSSTNVQVENIDEGDIVKTNGKQIFIARDNKVIVVNDVTLPLQDIYEVEVFEEEDDDEYYYRNNRIATMLIDEENDYLYVVYIRYQKDVKFSNDVLYPRNINIPITVLKTYEIENNSLEELNKIEILGNYYQSRFKDNYVYLITNNNNYEDLILPIYEWKDGTATSSYEKPVISPIDSSPSNKNMYTITTIKYDEKKSVVDSLDVLLDYSSTIYMSLDNLYLTHKTSYNRWYYGYNYDLTLFKEVYSKVYPKSIIKQIDEVIDNYDNQEKILEILNSYLETLSEDKQEALYENIQEEVDKYYENMRLEQQKTKITKIELRNDGKLGKLVEGEVVGNFLNQFSLDEDEDGYLRVALTYRNKNYENINSVIILDNTLKEYSKLDDIAKGESIYSSRFLGDKLFLVTFKHIDPFFVIDLSNKSKPEILGYLKIPGYSSYLHPISENYILGIGRNTKEEQWGVTTAGVKVSLFDVSDYYNPKEVSTYIVDNDKTSTPVEQDHKAFLYISKNNLAVIPVYENYYLKENEVGFHILEIKDGEITKKEVLNHEVIRRYYSYNDLLRSLYIGDNLYTISSKYIKTYNFDTQEITTKNI